MNIELILFNLVYKSWTRAAAHQAFDGRNRSRHQPEKGRFTHAEVNGLVNKLWQTFDELAPDVSHEPTVGSRMNVRLAGLTLALFYTLTAAGVEKDYAIELIGDFCWKVYQWWGRLKTVVASVSRRDPFKDQTRQIRKDGSWVLAFPFNAPGYRAKYVPTEKGLGFDMIHCPVAEYFRAHGASDLAVATWCKLDYALGQMKGIKLVLTQTLSAGDDHCDFRLFPAPKSE